MLIVSSVDCVCLIVNEIACIEIWNGKQMISFDFEIPFFWGICAGYHLRTVMHIGYHAHNLMLHVTENGSHSLAVLFHDVYELH